MSQDLKTESAYFFGNQPEIVEGHLGEWVVIKDETVIGYYKTEDEAFTAMAEAHEKLGTFMVHLCKNPLDDIINYHNNQVAFA
jgi:hypothetical protein